MKPLALRLHREVALLPIKFEDEEARTHLLIHLAIEEENEDRWCLWRPDHAGFDSRLILEGALVEE
jgi:hypothetical protein